MVATSEDLRRKQIIFGWTFVASSVVFLLSIPLVLYLYYMGESDSAGALSAGVPVIAVLVSMLSLIGFVWTAVLSLRR